jgi:hypothetical protein
MPPFFSAELNGQRVLALRHVFTVSCALPVKDIIDGYRPPAPGALASLPRQPHDSPQCVPCSTIRTISPSRPSLRAHSRARGAPHRWVCRVRSTLPEARVPPGKRAVARGCPPAGQVIHGGSEVDQRAPSSSSARKNAREHAFFAKEDEEISVSLLTDR